MPLHTRIIQSDFEGHLKSHRLRAFYWRYTAAKRDSEGTLPHVNDLSRETFAGLEQWSLRLLALPTGDFLYTQYGEEIAKSAGFSMVGRKVSSSSDKAFGFFLKCYEHVRDKRQPLITLNSALASRCVASWHRLMVPALDDAGQLNIITVLEPVCMKEAVIRALMQAIDDPVLILRMVRNCGHDVVDADIVDANSPAKTLLGKSCLHHCTVTELLPALLDEPHRACLTAAYAEAKTTALSEPISIAGQTFAGITASPIGDGAAILLKRG